MAAMVSFVALALMTVCVTANPYDYSTTVVANTPASALSYYPLDTPAYNDLKKSVYLMNQALGSIAFNAQSYYDYHYLNKYNTPFYAADYNKSLSKLASSEDYLNSSYNDYLRALNAYKASLNPAVAPAVLNDNVAINPALLAL